MANCPEELRIKVVQFLSAFDGPMLVEKGLLCVILWRKGSQYLFYYTTDVLRTADKVKYLVRIF